MCSSDVESMVLQPFTVQLANRDQTKPCGNSWDLTGMLRTDCSGEARLALHVPTAFYDYHIQSEVLQCKRGQQLQLLPPKDSWWGARRLATACLAANS